RPARKGLTQPRPAPAVVPPRRRVVARLRVVPRSALLGPTASRCCPPSAARRLQTVVPPLVGLLHPRVRVPADCVSPAASVQPVRLALLAQAAQAAARSVTVFPVARRAPQTANSRRHWSNAAPQSRQPKRWPRRRPAPPTPATTAAYVPAPAPRHVCGPSRRRGLDSERS